MRYKSKSALIEGHARVNCHERVPTGCEQGRSGIECMTWCSCNDRLVSFGNLSLQVIKLLQVLSQALVVAFLLHVVHGAEVCAIAPVLPMVWDHINGTSQSVLVH